MTFELFGMRLQELASRGGSWGSQGCRCVVVKGYRVLGECQGQSQHAWSRRVLGSVRDEPLPRGRLKLISSNTVDTNLHECYTFFGNG